MSSAFYTAVSGMKAFQENLDVTSHNIANVNTNGYKKQRVSFADLLYTRENIHKNYAAEGGTQAVQDAAQLSAEMVGHGVRAASVDMLYAQAGLNFTDRPLDFAITGDCFFAVNRDGALEYTRNGAFSLTMTSKKAAQLTSADGAVVLDGRQRPIKITFDENGQPELDGLVEKLGVYYFNNPYGLSPTAGSSFVSTDSSGPAIAATGKANEPVYEIMQGALEVSGVDLGQEMVKVIESQRAFQLNSRVVQTADQIDEMINNLR